ncbi:chalcone isomerase family protein [Thermodesulfobacteriota bacterium]
MKSKTLISVISGILLVAMLLILSSLEASAMKIAGVDVPQAAFVEKKMLVLNGAGIRKKLFIKVYVGSLYLTQKQKTVDKIMTDPGAKSIVMNFLYKEVSTQKLVDGWNKGFIHNSTAKEIRALKDRINKFNSLFTTVYKGDEIRLDYLPGEGTRVIINGVLKGSVPGEDFNQAILKIWLGSKPADANLKDAMLGNAY